MNHWTIAPILLPLATAVVLLFATSRSLLLQRTVNLLATILLLAIAVSLLDNAMDGTYQVYALGDWPAPYGIVLVLDRLSAVMLLLTALVAFFSLLYAVQGADAASRHFHALFQLQLMGLNGAFLTGDLFNLFVFFEVLLIASYGLLLHGGGGARLHAGLHYVVLNLAGSSLFLIAVGILYGATGTLNLADLAVRVANAPLADAALIRAGALLLLVVFGLKAALLPLYFWLPEAYSAATAPVAALFAIMTKVGVYAILRIFTLVFGSGAGAIADVASDWLLPLALTTLALGTLGALASRNLRHLVSYLLIASVGTLLTAIGLFSAQGIAAAIYYLLHSTLITAGLFLLADLLARQRGAFDDRFDPAALPVAQPGLLGALFFVAAVAVAGIPPLSGFLGKVLVLQAAPVTSAGYWVWGVVLATSLLTIISLSRAGSAIFWKTAPAVPDSGPAVSAGALLPTVLLVGSTVLLAALATPIGALAEATALQLQQPAGYIESVLHPASLNRN